MNKFMVLPHESGKYPHTTPGTGDWLTVDHVGEVLTEHEDQHGVRPMFGGRPALRLTGGTVNGAILMPRDLLQKVDDFQVGDVVDAHRKSPGYDSTAYAWAKGHTVKSVPDDGLVHTMGPDGLFYAFQPQHLTLVQRLAPVKPKPAKVDVNVGDTVTVRGVVRSLDGYEVVNLHDDETDVLEHESKPTVPTHRGARVKIGMSVYVLTDKGDWVNVRTGYIRNFAPGADGRAFEVLPMPKVNPDAL